MRTEWLHHKGASTLLLFFNGWSMDGRPFVPLAARDCDVLMACDYRELGGQGQALELERIMAGYGRIVLVAWSMGVWVAQQLLADYTFAGALAVNGTLCPMDARYGIPPELFRATRERFDEQARLKFYRRMCRGKALLERFLAHAPARDQADQQAELLALEQRVDCAPASVAIYDQVLICDQDYIMPTAHQRAYWAEGQEVGQGVRIMELAAPHFPFYRWHAWDELVALACGERDA